MSDPSKLSGVVLDSASILIHSDDKPIPCWALLLTRSDGSFVGLRWREDGSLDLESNVPVSTAAHIFLKAFAMYQGYPTNDPTLGAQE